MDKLYEALRVYLEERGLTSELDHTSSGERNLRLTPNLTVLLFVELYDEETGEHEVVPLTDLHDTLAEPT